MLAGVCTGFAAYLHIDVTIVRIVFLLLTLVTRGGFALAYFVLAFVIPPADTSEQRAAAHGEPFNAQQLIDQAKKHYAAFANGRGWRRRWRREQREWRRQSRAARPPSQRAWDGGWRNAPRAPGSYGSRMVSGAMVPILTVFSILFFWFWAWTVLSLVTTGQVIGHALPDEMPFWIGILVLVCVYHLVAWPLHFARRRARYYSLGGYDEGAGAWHGALSLTFGLLAVWVAYRYIPEVREVIRTLPDIWNSLVNSDLRI